MAEYEVFVQLRPDQPHTHAGSVRAASDELALHAAKEIYTRRDSPAGMWVVNRAQVLAFDPADRDLFAVAGAKEHRTPAYFTRRRERDRASG